MRIKQTLLIVSLAAFLTAPTLNAAPRLAPLSPSALLIQEDEEEVVEDKREVVKELLATFTKHTKKKGKEDSEAVTVLDKILGEFEVSGPKDRALIVKTIGKAMTLKRKEIDGVKEARVATAVAVCLGEMGPESVKLLSGLVSGKKLRGNDDLHRRAILSLGNTADGKAVKTLLGLSGDKSPKIQGAAIEALGNYGEEEQKVRKEIVEAMIKRIMPIKSVVDSDSGNTENRERYDVIGPPTITTMQRLSGQNIRDLLEWQRWWNKNKRKDWDEEE